MDGEGEILDRRITMPIDSQCKVDSSTNKRPGISGAPPDIWNVPLRLPRGCSHTDKEVRRDFTD